MLRIKLIAAEQDCRRKCTERDQKIRRANRIFLRDIKKPEGLPSPAKWITHQCCKEREREREREKDCLPLGSVTKLLNG